jgi:hypothetical protein
MPSHGPAPSRPTTRSRHCTIVSRVAQLQTPYETVTVDAPRSSGRNCSIFRRTPGNPQRDLEAARERIDSLAASNESASPA